VARTNSTRLEQAILETLWVNRIGARLTLTRNLALIVAAVIALAAPLAAGAITAPLRWPANIQIDRTKRPSSGETAAAQEKFEAAPINSSQRSSDP
jgi:hypothetical protein